MALTDENNGGLGATMLVSPTGNIGGYPYPYPIMQNGGGNGFGSGDWSWIIILLLFGMFGGYGGGFGGFGGFGGMGMLYPWLNQSNQINDGFRDQMLNGTVTGIQSAVTSGFGDVQTALCGGFAGVNASINSAQNALAQQMYANQLSDLQATYGVQSALQQCCCDNRAGLADLKYTVATEACADRAAVNDALKDVLAANTASTQRILDQLCADRLAQKDDTIAQLRSELIYAKGQASQDVQTARILAGQTSEVDALYERLNNCPVGTVPVYGRQPIFTCGNNGGCGCGCGAGFAN